MSLIADAAPLPLALKTQESAMGKRQPANRARLAIDELLQAARAKKKAVTDFSATAFDINRLSL